MYGAAPMSAKVDDVGTATSTGTTLPNGGVANAKNGTWTQLVASTPQHANGFIVCLGSATTALDYVVDIAIGAGGSETIICADLIACTGTGTGARIPQYVCPIPIPAGTRISARMAGSASSGTIRCSIELLSVLPGGVPPFQKMTTYGARLTGGVQVDPGASANTKGAYVPVGTVPVGQEIPDLMPGPATAGGEDENETGSIIVVVATDAPLLPHQLKRIATRVSLGVGRMGGHGGNSSGDIFVAFSTANPRVYGDSGVARVDMLRNDLINPLFYATVQATEEAIINALLAADTMTGIDDFRVYALPVDRLKGIMAKYGRPIR